MGPSLVETTVKTDGPALGLLGLGGLEKKLLTHVPSVGKESGPLGKANRPA